MNKSLVAMSKMKHLLKEFKTIQKSLLIAIDSFPANKREEKLFDQWSLKDVLAHLNHWYEHDLDCLGNLKLDKEPYWAPSVEEFNRQGVESRRNGSWDIVYNEFLDLGNRLTKEYENLPNDLWNKKFWKNKNLTPKKFLEIDLEHLGEEHLPEIRKQSQD